MWNLDAETKIITDSLRWKSLLTNRGLTPINVKAIAGTFNQEKALVDCKTLRRFVSISSAGAGARWGDVSPLIKVLTIAIWSVDTINVLRLFILPVTLNKLSSLPLPLTLSGNKNLPGDTGEPLMTIILYGIIWLMEDQNEIIYNRYIGPCMRV